ncbi:MAG: PAS domain-containing protein, partial [Chthoniobacterales bacterium]|nr:PAS domain-containing protein [Chthoniobacterales bacterium]
MPQPSLSEFAQTLVETSPDWELWLDTNLQLLFTNKKCLDYTGYTQDEFHKDPSLFLKILHPDDRKDISNQLQKNSPTHQTFSLRFQKKDKQISNVAFIKITIQEKQQKSPVYRLISRITPNTPTPVSQIDLKDFFLLISKVTNSPILLLDQNFTIQFASPSALILLEKNQSELLNSPFTKLFPTSSQLDLKNLVTSSAQIEYELPSKKSINLLLSFHPIPSPTLSYLLIINDLSKKSQNNLQLLKNVDRLREAERIAKLGHWIIELSTGNLEWSEQTYLMFGIPVGTPVNAETFFSTVHPDDRELVRKAWQNALDSGQTYEIEHRIIVDGEVRWMRERAETSRIEEGKIVGTVLDITEQKLTQLSLQRERDLFNSGPVFTIEWANQPGWPVRRVSSNVSSILGYSPEELTAESFRYSSLIHPEDLPRIEQEVQDHIQNNNNFYEQYYRMRTRSGEYRWFLDHTRVLRNEKNEVIGFQGYIQDDTPRKLAEETMRLHEERFRKLFNIASIGMAITDIETGRFVAVNDALAQATGYSKKELTQKTFWDITPPGYSSVDNAALLSLQQTGRCGPVEKAFLRKDG